MDGQMETPWSYSLANEDASVEYDAPITEVHMHIQKLVVQGLSERPNCL